MNTRQIRVLNSKTTDFDCTSMHFLISQNKKELYAVVCETLRYLEILNQIINNTKLIRREKKIIKNRFLGLVLLYEYLVGKGFHRLPKDLKVW